MAEFKTASDSKPQAAKQQGFRSVWYVQVHDSFSPLQMAPMSSLSMIGHRPCAEMTERVHGIYVRTKPTELHPNGREFIVPYGNISHYEYDAEK